MALEIHTPADNQYLVVANLSFGFATVLAIKSLDAARRVNELLLAGKERVAIRAYFQSNFGLGRARLPRLAARAMHRRVHVFRMNVRLHFFTCSCQEFFF
jgi:hypothetical protein